MLDSPHLHMENPYEPPDVHSFTPRRSAAITIEQFLTILLLIAATLNCIVEMNRIVSSPPGFWLGWSGYLWSSTPPLYSVFFASIAVFAAFVNPTVGRRIAFLAFFPVLAFAAFTLKVICEIGFRIDMAIWCFMMTLAFALVVIYSLHSSLFQSSNDSFDTRDSPRSVS